MKLHIGRVHKESKKINRELCENTLETREQIEKHLIIYEDINFPNAKKYKQSIEEMETIEYTEEFELICKDLETKSWEENRFNHRNIEIQVNDEELNKMEEYDEDERKCKVKEKLNEGGSENIEKLKDEKVLKKQIDWFENNSRVVKDIPDKFDYLFKEVGINRNDYRIYKVKANGACASNCVALHVHGESDLGT